MKKILLGILVLHILILSRLTFTAWPEMLSYPYLYSRGFLPYKDFIMPYPPGLILFLSGIFNIFSFDPAVLKTLTYGLIIIEDLLLYLIVRRVTGKSLFPFLFLAPFILLQSFLDGNMLWFDFASVLPILGAFYFLILWLEKKSLHTLFLIGIFLGVGIAIKQTAVIYLWVFGVVYFIVKKKIDLKELGVLLAAAFTIFVPLSIYIFSQNLEVEFWKWVILYPVTEWSKFPGYVNFFISRRQVFVLLLLAVPLVLIFKDFRKISRVRISIIAALFFVAALIAVYPRFSFFHLQPALAFLFVFLASISTHLTVRVLKLLIVIIFFSAFAVVALSYKQSVGDEIRFYSTGDRNLSKKIEKIVPVQERIFMLGLNSSLYVYSGRLPPGNWSDNFGWYLEIPEVQEWVIDGLKKNPPRVILRRTPETGRWFEPGTYQPKKILEYIYVNYQKADNIDRDIELWIKKS